MSSTLARRRQLIGSTARRYAKSLCDELQLNDAHLHALLVAETRPEAREIERTSSREVLRVALVTDGFTVRDLAGLVSRGLAEFRVRPRGKEGGMPLSMLVAQGLLSADYAISKGHGTMIFPESVILTDHGRTVAKQVAHALACAAARRRT